MLRTALLASVVLLAASSAFAQTCTGDPVAVQILGSGGPASRADRASSGYLLWIGSQAKVMVDMGGGAFARFGQAQAKFTDLSLMAISHLHPDHTSDLPALFWSGRNNRSDTLPIVGPSGNALAPSFPMFLSRLFDEKDGAFQFLGQMMKPTEGVVRLEPQAVDVAKSEPTTVFNKDGVTVTAIGIPHGNVPTLAYRVQTQNVSVVFSSDQTGTNPRFIDFARGADVLIMHLATNTADSPLHASPTVVGRVAQQAGVKRLIVSHIGVFPLDPVMAEVRAAYSGPVTIGADLQCTPVRAG